MIGSTFGPYRIVAKLGEGGMGEVYKARDTRLDRDVAIKVLPAAFASDPDRVARFEREAKAVAALSHPNVLAIFDTGTETGRVFVVTEILDGETLRERLTSQLPVRKAIDIAIQIARGLSAAHDKNIVHRDLKPENVFLTKDGQVKILDFGLARQISTNTGATATVSAMTDPGTVMGTVGYMAPEQVRGQATDARTDLFALGAVLYEMLSGRRAFTRDTAADTMFAIVKEDPPDLAATRPDLPPALDRIVRHSLEKNPNERFQTARDIAFALEALSGSGATSRVAARVPEDRSGRSRIVALGLGGAVLAALFFFVGRQTADSPPDLSSVQFARKTFDPQFVSNARFMPDGQTIVFSASGQGNIPELYVLRPDALIPLPLGQPRTHLLSISSKGELLVLTDAAVFTGGIGFGTIARMRNLDGAPQPWRSDVRVADWAPDGETMAIVRDTGGFDQLEYPVGTSLYRTSGYVSHVRVSPDGARVAFMDHQTRWDDRGWVKILNRGVAGEPTTLAGEFPGQVGLAWTRDGSTVVLSASVAGEDLGLRAVAIASPGRDRLVVPGPGSLVIHDIGPDGRWLVDRINFRNGIMALTPGHTAERDLTYAGNTWFGALSADGRQLLFTGLSAGTDYAVTLRGSDDARPKRLGDGNACGLSPDGKWALAYLPSSLRVIAYPTGLGNAVTLDTKLLERLSETFSLSWYPDSQHALVCGNERGQQSKCYRVSLDGSPAQAVTPEGVDGGLVRPNGQVLGRRSDGTFALYAPDGSAAGTVAGLTARDLLIGWSDDGRLFTGRPALPFELEKLDLQTGKRQPFKSLAPTDRAGVIQIDAPVTVTSDGRWYSYRYSQYLSTLFLLKGASTR